jgi:hypothetical protein
MSKSHRLKFIFAGASVFVLLLLGSIGTKPPPPIQVSPRFDFIPPVSGDIASNGIDLILLQPVYDKQFVDAGLYVEPFRTFIEHMGTDIVEMLVARGFRYVGPIPDDDQVVFSQKKNADLTLKVEMSWEQSGLESALRRRSYTPYLSQVPIVEYYWDGLVNIGCRLNMWLYEPFTRQKVWVKAISIPPIPVMFKTYRRYQSDRVPYSDPALWNTIVPEMEKMYTQILNTMWTHLDPEELQQIKREALEIGKNSGYQRN